MCRNEMKRIMHDAINNGAPGNGWTQSQSKSQRQNNLAYIDLYQRAYPESSTVARAAITLFLDANGAIRCYPHLTFREVRASGWQADFFQQVGNIPGMTLEQVLPKKPAASGIAVNAILVDQSWRDWTSHCPKEAIATLRKCCTTLREWTDKYVETLP